MLYTKKDDVFYDSKCIPFTSYIENAFIFMTFFHFFKLKEYFIYFIIFSNALEKRF